MRSINIDTIESIFLQKLLVMRHDRLSSSIQVYANDELYQADQEEKRLCESLIKKLQGRPV